MSNINKTINAHKVLKRTKSPVGTWLNWKQILRDEKEIQIVFNYDEDTITFFQKDEYKLHIKSLVPGRDSFRGNYLKMKCIDNRNIECEFSLYGSVEPFVDYKRIFIVYDEFQISYHY